MKVETTNKSIIDYAILYVNKMNLTPKLVPPINHMRNYKKIYLPCELVGMTGRARTYEYENDESSSYFL